MALKELSDKQQQIEQILNLPSGSLTIIDSPIRQEYRNNQFYVFSTNIDGKFDVGLYAKPKSQTVKPCELDPRGSLQAKVIARCIYNWAIHHELQPYNKELQTGLLRRVRVRDTITDDISITIGISKQNKDSYFKWLSLQESLFEVLKKECKLHKWILRKIYCQVSDSAIEPKHETSYDELYSDGEFVDTICEMKVHRSPDSFFQPNRYTAKIIYDLIKQIALTTITTDKTQILLDICCGTGTIGIYLSSLFDKVLGIDRTSGSINDAKRNAIANSSINCHYFLGNAEELLPQLIKQYKLKTQNVVAIINPPRRGIYPQVIDAINDCDHIDGIIYVSCNVNSLKRDLELLKFNQIEQIIAVNQFPMTSHCEVIVKLSKGK